jgi:CII-binding regulator of phage lambda lysogenization HflD
MTDSGYAVTSRNFIKMKQKLQKLEQMIEILQRSTAQFQPPLHDKLPGLAKLYVNTASMPYARPLCVSRGTFYNQYLPRKVVTAYDKRRVVNEEHIQAAFDEASRIWRK